MGSGGCGGGLFLAGRTVFLYVFLECNRPRVSYREAETIEKDGGIQGETNKI